MSEIANITRLLLDKDEANRYIGAYTAVGLGLGEQILEHYERELEQRITGESSLARAVKSFSQGSEYKPISHINVATWALKHALGKKVYIHFLQSKHVQKWQS